MDKIIKKEIDVFIWCLSSFIWILNLLMTSNNGKEWFAIWACSITALFIYFLRTKKAEFFLCVVKLCALLVVIWAI